MKDIPVQEDPEDARKEHRREQIFARLRQIEVAIANGKLLRWA